MKESTTVASRRKLLLIDTCHSGELDKDAPAAPVKPALCGPAPDASGVPDRGAPASGAVAGHQAASTARDGVHVQVFPRDAEDASVSVGLQNTFTLMQEMFADLRRGTGAVVIAASSGAGYSLESDQWKNGVFTASVLEALTAHPDTSLGALRKWVGNRVQERTDGKQTVTTRQGTIEHDWRVY